MRLVGSQLLPLKQISTIVMQPHQKNFFVPKIMSDNLLSFIFSGVLPISDGQDDFFTMNPHMLNGIDVSQVQDIGKFIYINSYHPSTPKGTSISPRNHPLGALKKMCSICGFVTNLLSSPTFLQTMLMP